MINYILRRVVKKKIPAKIYPWKKERQMKNVKNIKRN